MIGRAWRWWQATRERRRFEHEMAEEMADHLVRRTDDLIREGLSPSAAARRARIEFGSIEGFKEECRSARRLDLGDELVRNLRHAVRTFARAPGLTVAVTLTLGLGIGANVAVFSVVDAVLLRPLPYPDADRLAIVETRFGRSGATQGRVGTHNGATWQTIDDQVEALDLAVFSSWSSDVNVVAGQRVEHMRQQRIGSGFFRVLGIGPYIGRSFSPEEDVAGGPDVAILGHATWQRLFEADPSIVGRTVQLRGAPHQIIGVMPEGFRTPTDAQLWTPLRPSTTGEGEGTNYTILARLRPGARWQRADAELRTAGAPAMVALRSPEGTERWLGLEPLQQSLAQGVRHRLLLSWLAVWLVLAVACVNVAGLLLAHAARRRREIATRMALGGGRAAILRQLLTENLVLSTLGGAVGLGVAMLGMKLLDTVASGPLGLWRAVTIDGRVLGLTFGLAVLSVLLSGLQPARAASRLDLRTAAGGAAGRVVGQDRSWSRRALSVAQLAVVTALLAGAGLLVRTVQHLEGLPPGFDPDGVVAGTVSLEDARYRLPTDVERLLESVAAQMRAQPDIEHAAAGLGLPYERPLNMGVTLPGDDDSRITNLTYVTPGFFETLGIGLVRGRLLDRSDRAEAAPVVVVNRAFVRAYLEGRQPLGMRIATAGRERTIVGVVADTQQRPSWGDAAPLGTRAAVYVPVAQTSADFLQLVHGWFQPSWVIRPAVRSVPVAERLRAAVEAVDPHLPLARVRTFDQVRADVLSRERFQATLLTVAAGLALLLAAVGLAGLIATTVAHRRRELGVRLALGATRFGTVRSAAAPAMTTALLGLAAGLPLTLAVVHGLRSFLHGVGVFDPMTYLTVAATLLAVATLASLLPALRVLKLDPATTLRAE